MSRTITADAETLLAEVLDNLASEPMSVMIEHGQERAVLLRAEVYDDLMRIAALNTLDAIHAENANSESAELEREIAEAVSEVRQKRGLDTGGHAHRS